ncbi:MAG: TRAP transporter small permease [Gammaproteobacteria bacterium]
MKRLVRIYDSLIKGLAGCAGLLIAATCLIIVYDVVARNLGLQPPRYTIALTEYALLYFTMAAAPWLVRNRGHIVVEVLYSRTTGAVRVMLDRLILVLCAGISALISALAALLMLEAWQRGEIELRSLDMPRWLLFFPLVIGFVLMAVEFVRLLISGESVSATDALQKEIL